MLHAFLFCLSLVATRTPLMSNSEHITSSACFTKVQFLAKEDQPTQSLCTSWSEPEKVKSYFFGTAGPGGGKEKSDCDISSSFTWGGNTFSGSRIICRKPGKSPTYSSSGNLPEKGFGGTCGKSSKLLMPTNNISSLYCWYSSFWSLDRNGDLTRIRLTNSPFSVRTGWNGYSLMSFKYAGWSLLESSFCGCVVKSFTGDPLRAG
mmetsp:Transcript_66221/g.158012  ORF Transcript_66221/g.158012 Transcript_66221/m.158012 type:complete len:205 (+) Transcript_66221:561-1175(+)